MLQTPFEAQTHTTFDALMWAFAHPGRIQHLRLEPNKPAFITIAEALLDLETSAWTNDKSLEPALRNTGAKIKPLDEAAYVFCSQIPSLELLRAIKRGTPLAPETAATLLVSAKLAGGLGVRFSGAGIQDTIELNIDLPLEFVSIREEVISFPIGWDVLIVDGANILGIPRTTRIEVI